MLCIINDINHALEKLRGTQGSNYFTLILNSDSISFSVGKIVEENIHLIFSKILIYGLY